MTLFRSPFGVVRKLQVPFKPTPSTTHSLLPPLHEVPSRDSFFFTYLPPLAFQGAGPGTQISGDVILVFSVPGIWPHFPPRKPPRRCFWPSKCDRSPLVQSLPGCQCGRCFDPPVGDPPEHCEYFPVSLIFTSPSLFLPTSRNRRRPRVQDSYIFLSDQNSRCCR